MSVDFCLVFFFLVFLMVLENKRKKNIIIFAQIKKNVMSLLSIFNINNVCFEVSDGIAGKFENPLQISLKFKPIGKEPP